MVRDACRLKEAGGIDLVIFAGDVAARGKAEEFEAARALTRLRKERLRHCTDLPGSSLIENVLGIEPERS